MIPLTESRPVWKSVKLDIPGIGPVRVTAVRADEIVFDRLDSDGNTVSNAHGAPCSLFDPTKDDFPASEKIIAAIAAAPVRAELSAARNALPLSKSAAYAR